MMDTTRVAKAIRQQADEMGSVLQELERLRAQVDELRTRYAHLERKAAEDAKRYTEMLAALTAERDAARAAADPDLSDYYEPAIVVTELQNEVAALRRQLSQAHIRLDWYAQFSGLPTPPWEQAIPEPPEEGA